MPENNLKSENRFLSFLLGGASYAIPLLSVKEVIALPAITAMPQSQPYFLGIFNLRGSVIPVIDLRKRLEIKPVESKETSVIICHIPPMNMGVVVDSISAVIAPAAGDFSEKPSLQGSKADPYITGVYRAKDSMVLFLDPTKILSSEDQRTLAANYKQSA